MASTSAPRRSTSRPSPSKRSTWPNTSRCSTTCACGTGTHFTTRCRSFSRTGFTPMRNTDVDRYTIDGKMRQVLISPRELDLDPARATRWINTHFIYTHGYGIVMAEANRVSPNGLPVLAIKDTPPEISAARLEADPARAVLRRERARPRVRAYRASPSSIIQRASTTWRTRYDGKGGFPISSLLMRLAAAVSDGDWNILLTELPHARKPHDDPPQRAAAVGCAGRFSCLGYRSLPGADRRWPAGLDRRRLHDIATCIRIRARSDWKASGPFNYIRNSVKATVDAYDGTVHLYVFDPEDPLLQAYRNLFPSSVRARLRDAGGSARSTCAIRR